MGTLLNIIYIIPIISLVSMLNLIEFMTIYCINAYQRLQANIERFLMSVEK